MEFIKKVKLPGAVLYEEGNVLREGIEIKNMTVADEKLFLSNSGAIAFDKMLSNCIVTKGVDVSSLLESDKAFLLFQIRELTYGEEFIVKFEHDCGAKIDLVRKIADIPLNIIESVEEYDTKRELTLPMSKINIRVKLISGKDSKNLEKRLAELKRKNMKVDRGTEYVYTIATCIDTVDGEEKSLTERVIFLEKMHARDAAYLRKKIEDIRLGYDLVLDEECPNCGEMVRVRVDLDEEFFRPTFDD